MENTQVKPQKRKKKKNKSDFMYYSILFVFVFVCALFAMSYFVDSYTPDIDVSIGNSEPATIGGSELMQEERTVDERLKWIKEEDELPSVVVNEPTVFKKEPEQEKSFIKKVIELPKKKDYDEVVPKIEHKETKENKKIADLTSDFRRAAVESGVVPLPVKRVSKVFVGNYNTIEEAVQTQNNIVRENMNVIPFVKNYNGAYVVQIGSFSDSDKAHALASELSSKGYSVKIISDN